MFIRFRNRIWSVKKRIQQTFYCLNFLFKTRSVTLVNVQDSIEVPRLKDLKSHSFPNHWTKEDIIDPEVLIPCTLSWCGLYAQTSYLPILYYCKLATLIKLYKCEWGGLLSDYSWPLLTKPFKLRGLAYGNVKHFKNLKINSFINLYLTLT